MAPPHHFAIHMVIFRCLVVEEGTASLLILETIFLLFPNWMHLHWTLTEGSLSSSLFKIQGSGAKYQTMQYLEQQGFILTLLTSGTTQNAPGLWVCLMQMASLSQCSPFLPPFLSPLPLFLFSRKIFHPPAFHPILGSTHPSSNTFHQNQVSIPTSLFWCLAHLPASYCDSQGLFPSTLVTDVYRGPFQSGPAVWAVETAFFL